MKKLVFCAILPLMTGCLGYPADVRPVAGFKLQNYLGKWYEIARLDHSFERGLDKVTAEYSMRDDGGVKVKNRGYSTEKGKWKEAIGKAFFVDTQDIGYLKVSFFGPFYGSYVVFELDKENYKYAFVTSSSKSYLWFLSRTPTVEEKMKQKFVERVESMGFDSKALIWVDHE
ncbi:MAG: lipocalin family protein [Candidatus Krumholzibacteriota bacterium]|nr:lipocalin family protein [Candidatus Krumholzibacteriota bacterium]